MKPTLAGCSALTLNSVGSIPFLKVLSDLLNMFNYIYILLFLTSSGFSDVMRVAMTCPFGLGGFLGLRKESKS